MFLGLNKKKARNTGYKKNISCKKCCFFVFLFITENLPKLTLLLLHFPSLILFYFSDACPWRGEGCLGMLCTFEVGSDAGVVSWCPPHELVQEVWRRHLWPNPAVVLYLLLTGAQSDISQATAESMNREIKENMPETVEEKGHGLCRRKPRWGVGAVWLHKNNKNDNNGEIRLKTMADRWKEKASTRQLRVWHYGYWEGKHVPILCFSPLAAQQDLRCDKLMLRCSTNVTLEKNPMGKWRNL